MKKFIALITLVSMLSCVSCTDKAQGDSTPASASSITETPAAETTAAENSEEAAEAEEAVTEAEKEDGIEPTQEILDAELADLKIQLGTHVYQFPIPIQQLLDDGAVITNNEDPDKDIVERYPDGNMDAHDVDFILDGKNYSLYFSPLTRGRIHLRECLAFNANDYWLENKNHNVLFPKGIKAGSTVEELINAWGEPTTKYGDEWYYDSVSKEYDDYTVEYKYIPLIDSDSQTVEDIRLVEYAVEN